MAAAEAGVAVVWFNTYGNEELEDIETFIGNVQTFGITVGEMYIFLEEYLANNNKQTLFEYIKEKSENVGDEPDIQMEEKSYTVQEIEKRFEMLEYTRSNMIDSLKNSGRLPQNYTSRRYETQEKFDTFRRIADNKMANFRGLHIGYISDSDIISKPDGRNAYYIYEQKKEPSGIKYYHLKPKISAPLVKSEVILI